MKYYSLVSSQQNIFEMLQLIHAFTIIMSLCAIRWNEYDVML